MSEDDPMQESNIDYVESEEEFQKRKKEFNIIRGSVKK